MIILVLFMVIILYACIYFLESKITKNMRTISFLL